MTALDDDDGYDELMADLGGPGSNLDEDDSAASENEGAEQPPLVLSAAARAKAEKDFRKIEEYITGKAKAHPRDADRRSRKDMALGVTEPRSNLINSNQKLLLKLTSWIKVAGEANEAELLGRFTELKFRAEGAEGQNTNLRIFGDQANASTWMDWQDVDGRIKGQYRSWFTECATKPLLATDGRFKFNLSGFDPEYTKKLVRDAAFLSQVEIDRRVDSRDEADQQRISKTDWEILEVLSNPALLGRTDFLLFDKKTHDAPIMMDELMRDAYGVLDPLTLISHDQYLVRVAEEAERAAKAKADYEADLAAQERFRKMNLHDRMEVFTARWTAELQKYGLTLADPDAKKAYDAASTEVDWPTWTNFEDLWKNESKWFFDRLAGVQ